MYVMIGITTVVLSYTTLMSDAADEQVAAPSETAMAASPEPEPEPAATPSSDETASPAMGGKRTGRNTQRQKHRKSHKHAKHHPSKPTKRR